MHPAGKTARKPLDARRGLRFVVSTAAGASHAGGKQRAEQMRKTAKRLLGGLALAVGGVGAVALLGRRRAAREAKVAERGRGLDRWARPGMSVTFRGELMPGRQRAERTFRVAELLPSGRVRLEGVAGEHTESEFEHAR
ncbi:MAG TPA: hypothetical protein VK388_06265 [Pyrinomonadaceae bacterium]|nr:hypothetical protein [Pyrinomonadaceae bacterium]